MLARHEELFRVMGEFYTLLAQLAIISPEAVKFPGPSNGAFHSNAALAAGYTPEAVYVMSGCPYISSDIEYETEIIPSTYAVDLYEMDSEDTFEGFRHLDEMTETDEPMPGSIVRFTIENIYGYLLLYDTETGLMYDWQCFESEFDDYALMTPRRPAEVMQRWIDKYRSLTYLYVGDHIQWDRIADDEREPPAHYSPGEKELYRAELPVREAERQIEQMYLDCGWSTTSQTQEAFDRDRFLALRKCHIEDVISPLQDKASKLWTKLRQPPDLREEL